MKQIIQIVIFSLSLLIGNLNAQGVATINAEDLEKLPEARNIFDVLNVEAGINLSSTTNSLDYDRRAGITVGVSTEMDGSTIPFIKDVPVINDFRYKIGIGFEQFGSKWSDSKKDEWGKTTEKIKYRFNYVSLPLTFLYPLYFLPCETYFLGGLKPRFLVGGKDSWRLKYVSDSDGSDWSNSASQNVKDNSKNLDLGIIFGFGTPFSFKGQKFTAELKYEIGLRNVWDNSDSDMDESSDSKLKNNAILASFAWQLAL